MKNLIMTDDITRLVRAAERMARIAQDIAERGKRDATPAITGSGECPRSPEAAPGELVHAAKSAMAAHLQQPDFGAAAIFRSPEWLLMLELFAADRSGVDVSVKAASITLGGAPSTANRTILELERLGLIASFADEKDARRRLLKLTPHVEAILHEYLTRQSEHRPFPIRVSLKVSHLETHDDPADVSGETSSIMDRSETGTESILQ